MTTDLPPPAALNGRVLVVEDEFLIAAMVQDMLSDFGVECVGPIATLPDGIHAAKNEAVHAAIINLMIQGEVAYEITEALLERNIPFCFASGVAPSGIPEKWRDRPFLMKPYIMDDVRKFLQSVLPPPA